MKIWEKKITAGGKKEGCAFVHCDRGEDNTRHFLEDFKVTKNWLESLEKNEEKRLNRIYSDELDKKERVCWGSFRFRRERKDNSKKRRLKGKGENLGQSRNNEIICCESKKIEIKKKLYKIKK